MKKSLLFVCALGVMLGALPFAPPATAATQAAKPAAAKPAAAAPAKPAAAADLVDLNSASKEVLMKLPAIGEAIAGKIISGRPWTNKAQLLSKGVLTKAAYNKVAPLIVAKQAAK